jgi:hypothetical protein
MSDDAQDLDARLRDLVAPAGAPGDVPHALRAQVTASLAPAPRVPPWRRALPAVATALFAVTAIALASPRADLSRQPAARMLVALAAWSVGMLSGLALLLSPGRFGLGFSARARALWLLGSVAVFEAVAFWSTVAVEGSLRPQGAAAALSAALCALGGSLVAALVGAALLRGARRTAVVSPRSAAWVAGAAAGFAGVLAQQLHCAVASRDHTMTAHLAPVLVGALVASRVAPRWLRA